MPGRASAVVHMSQIHGASSYASFPEKKLDRHLTEAEVAGKVHKEMSMMLEWMAVKNQIKSTRWDLIAYLFYLMVVTVVVFNLKSEYEYRLNQAMKDLIIDTEVPSANVKKTFVDILEVADIYEWLKEVFLVEMFNPYFPSYSKDTTLGGYPLGMNALIGPVRMRQARVEKEDCAVTSSVASMFEALGCFPIWSKGAVDTSWTRKWANTTPSTVTDFHDSFDYTESTDTDIDAQWAEQETYEGGGYVVDFGRSNTTAEHILGVTALESSKWIDLGTRAVILDFTVYNPSLNLFHVSQLFLEIMPTGAVLPSFQMNTVNLWRYDLDSSKGKVQVVFEIIFVIMTLGYFFVEVKEIISDPHAYLSDLWNYLDTFVVCMFLVAMCLRASTVSTFLGSEFDADNPGTFFPFQPLLIQEVHTNNIIALSTFLLWFKIFKFTTVVPGMDVISKTITASFKNTSWFLVMFSFVLIGYATAGVLAFGQQMRSFGTFLRAVSTLMGALLGDIILDDLLVSNRYFGALFFFSFVVLCFFILLSMFLAILSEAYESVKMERNRRVSLEYSRLIKEDAQKKSERSFIKGNRLSTLAGKVKSERERARKKRDALSVRDALTRDDMVELYRSFHGDIERFALEDLLEAQAEAELDAMGDEATGDSDVEGEAREEEGEESEKNMYLDTDEDSDECRASHFFSATYGVNINGEAVDLLKQEKRMLRKLRDEMPSSNSDESDDESITALKKIVRRLRTEIKELHEAAEDSGGDVVSESEIRRAKSPKNHQPRSPGHLPGRLSIE